MYLYIFLSLYYTVKGNKLRVFITVPQQIQNKPNIFLQYLWYLDLRVQLIRTWSHRHGTGWPPSCAQWRPLPGTGSTSQTRRQSSSASVGRPLWPSLPNPLALFQGQIPQKHCNLEKWQDLTISTKNLW